MKIEAGSKARVRSNGKERAARIETFGDRGVTVRLWGSGKGGAPKLNKSHKFVKWADVVEVDGQPLQDNPAPGVEPVEVARHSRRRPGAQPKAQPKQRKRAASKPRPAPVEPETKTPKRGRRKSGRSSQPAQPAQPTLFDNPEPQIEGFGSIGWRSRLLLEFDGRRKCVGGEIFNGTLEQARALAQSPKRAKYCAIFTVFDMFSGKGGCAPSLHVNVKDLAVLDRAILRCDAKGRICRIDVINGSLDNARAAAQTGGSTRRIVLTLNDLY